MAVSTVEGHEPSCSRITDEDNAEARLGIRLPPTTRSPQGPRTNQLIYIRDVILKAMIRHPGSFWFRKPIDPVKLRLVNYYQFIKQPMDLETIRNRITNRYYQGAKECLEDFQLMFCNCYVYNLPDSAVTKEARELEMTLLRKLVDMEETEEVIPEGTPIYKKKQWSTTKECAILNQNKEEDEGGNGEEIRRALRVREPKKSLEVEVVEVPKKAGGGKKIKSGGNEKKIGKNAKGKKGSVFYRLNKERRKKRLEMIEKQMDFLKGLVEQMKKDEVKDKQLCRKQKRKRSRSSGSGSGGEKKKKTGSRRSRSGTPIKKTPTKSQQDGADSSKTISPMGPPPPPKSAAVKTPKPKPVATPKSKSVATSKPKSVATSKPKPVATSKPKPVATSKPKPPSTPTPSTSNSKATSIPTPSSSKSKTPELLLDKTSRMSPEILQQLKSMLDQLSDEDMADIVQVVSYYDYEEPEEEDDEDILNLKALPHTCQWEIWGMTETKLGMANAKKKSKETTEVVLEKEVESASVVPSAVQVDNDPFIFGAVHQDSPDPVPDPSSRTEPVVPVFSSMDDDINDDDDEDDDTLLDIY